MKLLFLIFAISFNVCHAQGWKELKDDCSTVNLDMTVAASDSYTWIDGNTYTVSNNFATHVLTDSFGCDSTIVLALTIENENIDLTTTTSGLTIAANQLGATYQWLDCNNNYAPIPGETNDSMQVSANGNYAVIITVGNYSDTSIDIVSITEILDSFEVGIFPTPSNGNFYIKSNVKDLMLTVYSLDGKVIGKDKPLKNTKELIDLTSVESGVYIVDIQNSFASHVSRIVIQE